MGKERYSDHRGIMHRGLPGLSNVPAIPLPGGHRLVRQDHTFFGAITTTDVVPPGWTVKATSGTIASADIQGGGIVMNCPGTIEDYAQISLGTVGGGAYFPAAGYDIVYYVRMKASITGVASNENIAFGLIDTEDSEYYADGGGGCTINRIAISKLLNETDWSIEVGSTGGDLTRQSLDTARAPANLTVQEFVVRITELGEVRVYVDGHYQASDKITNDIPATGLMPFFFIKAGDTEVEALYPLEWYSALLKVE